MPVIVKRRTPARGTAFQPRSIADQLKILYRPAWNAATQSIDTFFFRAFTDTGANVFSASGPLLNGPTTVDVLRAATTAFQTMRINQVRATFVLPVQFAALEGYTLREIQRLVSALDHKDRFARLRLEITRVPLDQPLDRLVVAREVLRPYAREVAFLADALPPADPVYTLEHIVLGTDVSSGTLYSDDDFFQHMLGFRRRAGARPTYVLGIRSRSQLSRAVSAGIGEVGGTALAEDRAHLPDHVAPLPRTELVPFWYSKFVNRCRELRYEFRIPKGH